MNRTQMLLTALKAAVDAGAAILDVYQTDFDVQSKSDQSPLTLADQRSHKIIAAALRRFNIPLLSEEGRTIPFEERKEWRCLWVVDPLDGTKEFIKRNDEFTVNIALVEAQRPTLGVVYLPVKDLLYLADKDLGAYRLDTAAKHLQVLHTQSDEPISDVLNFLDAKAQQLPLSRRLNDIYTIVGSRSHASQALKDFVAQKEAALGKVHFISAGSSLKICLVAEGKADIYPRLGPTMEWDTAAGQAIVEIAGASLKAHDSGQPLRYNKEDLLNPWFVVERRED